MSVTRLGCAVAAGAVIAVLGLGSALAGEPAPHASAADSDSLLGVEELGLQPMETAELHELSGGMSFQAGIVSQTQHSSDNDITINGNGNISTGAVDNSINATGGISSTAVVSGINNSVQISTTLNLYFNQAAPQSP
jgi:hypothetical protein